MGAIDPAKAGRNRRTRPPRQGRSEDAVAKIAKAVVALLASEGQAALTHRRVADAAGVSLAATTYYYANKFDMVADAQKRLLDEYVEAFVRAKVRHQAGDPIVHDLPELVAKLVKNATGRHGRDTLAWSEIMLDCARDPRGHVLAREWFDRMTTVWRALLVELGVKRADEVVNPAIDTAVGLLFITVSLQLSAEEVGALLSGRRSLAEIARRLSERGDQRSAERPRPGGRSRETRERIVGAAVAALEAGDPAGLSFTAIAQRANLTNAAPAYHFPTMDALIDRAHDEVLQRMVGRNLVMMTPLPAGETRPSAAADLLAAIHIRNILEHGVADIAGYSTWLNAARKPGRRTEVARAILASQAAFAKYLTCAPAEVSRRSALLLLAQFTGRAIRVMATGTRTADLADARGEFELMIAAIGHGGHPILQA